MNKLPRIDLLSFIFGAILSLLLVFVITQIRKLSPRLRSTVKSRKQAKSKDTAVTTELLLQKYFLQKAQSSHLAAPLFSLNDIYVDLKFISKPYFISPSKTVDDEPTSFTVTSYFSDFPELITQLPVPLLTLEESLSAGQNICILGELGSGKTTALAHLATQILEKKCELQALNNLTPFYFHIHELLFDESIEINIPDLFCKTILEQRPVIKSEFLQDLILGYLSNKQAIFLIDGLDELSSDQLLKPLKLISQIHAQFPELPIVTTLGPWATFDLTKYNFSFITIQYPDNAIRSSLLSKWKIAWNSIKTGDTLHNIHGSEGLTTLWYGQENSYLSIFDATLSCWSYCALDSRLDKLNPISAYLTRVTHNHLSMETLKKIAKAVSLTGFSGISYEAIEDFIKQDMLFQHSHDPEKQLDTSVPSEPEPTSSTITVSNEKALIKELNENHLFKEYSPGSIQFSNPSILACLAAQDDSYPKKIDWKALLTSPLDDSITRRSKDFTYLVSWMRDSDGILFRNLLLAIKHSVTKPIDSALQATFYQAVISQIQKLSLPFSQKLKLLSVFILRQDSSLSQVFGYFEKTGKKDLLQLSAFSYGYQKDQSRINFLIDCINSSDQVLHLFCIMALYRNWNKQSKEIFTELLSNGRENQQRIVAELLSQKDPEGHRMLEELSTNKNLLCRKAVTQGLRLISSDWATTLLEKMSTGDKEWFVRDAAVHALQNRWSKTLYIPQQFGNPLDAPWLINYASRTGQSLPVDEYPYGLLYQIINEGTFEEKLTSIGYLTARPDIDTQNILTNITLNNSNISEEALLSLQQIAKSDF